MIYLVELPQMEVEMGFQFLELGLFEFDCVKGRFLFAHRQQLDD